MPFGIIDTKDDTSLAGTEYLLRDDSTISHLDVDSAHLKRVMYKVNQAVVSQFTGPLPLS